MVFESGINSGSLAPRGTGQGALETPALTCSLGRGLGRDVPVPIDPGSRRPSHVSNPKTQVWRGSEGDEEVAEPGGNRGYTQEPPQPWRPWQPDRGLERAGGAWNWQEPAYRGIS